MVADSFKDRTFKISSISKPFCDAAVFLALCRPYQYYNTRTCDSKINSLVIPKKMNKYYTISDYVLGCIFNVLIYAEVIAGKKRLISGLTCEECTCILSLVLKGWIFQSRLR